MSRWSLTLPLLVVCTTLLLLQQPCSAAPRKSSHVPAEWRDSEDHIPQVRHHHVKHEQTPAETTEVDVVPKPEESDDKEDKDSHVLPPVVFVADEKREEQLPEEDLTSTHIEEKIEEVHDAAKQPEELSNALPSEKYEEETKPEAEKSYPVHPKLKIDESGVLVKEFQQDESPKEPLVSLSLVKEYESGVPPAKQGVKSFEEIEKPQQHDESLSTNEVFDDKKSTVIKSEVIELKVLSPMLTLPKEDSKEQWSIVVKERPALPPLSTQGEQQQITEDDGKEQPEEIKQDEAMKPKEDAPAKAEESIVKEDVVPLLDEVYAALVPEETPVSVPEPQDPSLYTPEQVKVNVIYDEPTNAENLFVKDLQEDIIKDVSNAIKDKVDQVQTDLIASKNKFEERFQAVREGIKVKQDYIKEAVQQKKDKINDFIDKFIFKINTTTADPTEATTTEPTSGTSSPTSPTSTTEPNVTDPPPGPPEADDEQPKQQQPQQEIDGTARQSEEVAEAQELLVEGDEKQSNFIQQAQQFIQNVQQNFQGLQTQFTQTAGGAANGGAVGGDAADGVSAEQSEGSGSGTGSGTGSAPATGGQNIFQNFGQAVQAQIQNFQNQFRPPQDTSSSSTSTNGELSNGESGGVPPAEQNVFQQVGQAVQTGFQNVQTNIQGGIQNIQNTIQQQQTQISAGSEGGQINPQNFLQQFGTAVQNGFQNVQNAFSPPAQSASVVSDTASGEPQRPNIIQQGIQNFQAAVVKPVQQLFQQPTSAKPIIEAADDVPVLQGSTTYDEQDYDEQEAVNTVKKQRVKSGAVNKVEKVDKYVKSAPTVEILVKSDEEKPAVAAEETAEAVEDKKPEDEMTMKEESPAEKFEAPLKNLVVVDETVEVVAAPVELKKTLLDESKTEDEVSDKKTIQYEDTKTLVQGDITEEKKPLKSFSGVEKTEEVVVVPVGTVEVTPV